MNFFKKLLRKRALLKVTGLLTVYFMMQPVYAYSLTELFLAQIRNTTYSILQKLNETPAYLEEITKMAMSWNNTDDPSDFMANTQSILARINANDTTTRALQASMSLDYTNSFLLLGSPSKDKPTLPDNPNDLNYDILAGQSLPNTDASNRLDAAAKNYIAYLGGLKYSINQPDPHWRDTPETAKYLGFYNTVAAIKSLNAYILSGLYQQQDSEEAYTQLMQQAGNSAWFEQVSSEPLGVVLRQILMYNSQIFLQLTRLIKIQQQMLAEQTATSALISMTAQELTGSQLWMKANQASR